MQILPRLDLGGVEKGTVEVARALKEAGRENIVVSSGGRLVKTLQSLNIPHYKLSVHKKSPLSFFSLPKLCEIIEREEVEIIHARSRVPAWISFFASRIKGKHFISTAHGIYKNKFFSSVMCWGKFVICPSQAVARHLLQNFSLPQEKIVIIPRWVNLDDFSFFNPRAHLNNDEIVAMGRISPSKGYEYLLEAFRRLRREFPFLKLNIVGEAERKRKKYFQKLQSIIENYSLTRYVKFSGYTPSVAEVLRKARVLVMPSVVEESFGRVIIEAFAAGVPVVATSVGGVREIVSQKEGLLVEPRDSDSLARAILKILSDTRLSTSYVIAARKKVEEQYSFPLCRDKIFEVYKKCEELVRILVIKISSLGDVILSIPSLKALKEHFPTGKIYLLTLKQYASLFYSCPFVDEVIALDKDYKNLNTFLRVSSILRNKSFDYIVDLQNTYFSHLVSFFAFARFSAGYRRQWGKLLKISLPLDKDDNPLTSQEKVIACLGVKLKEKKLTFWDLEPTSLPLKPGNYIGIVVSASSRWKSKNWDKGNIISFINMIHKNFPHYRVVLLGDENAKPISSYLVNYLYPAPLDLCGRTSLSQLPGVIKMMKVFITPDTALLHLAQSLGVATVALFGPTSPSRHIVKSDNLVTIFKKLSCSFCYKHICPLGENICMKKITAREVFSKIKSFL